MFVVFPPSPLPGQEDGGRSTALSGCGIGRTAPRNGGSTPNRYDLTLDILVFISHFQNIMYCTRYIHYNFSELIHVIHMLIWYYVVQKIILMYKFSQYVRKERSSVLWGFSVSDIHTCNINNGQTKLECKIQKYNNRMILRENSNEERG